MRSDDIPPNSSPFSPASLWCIGDEKRSATSRSKPGLERGRDTEVDHPVALMSRLGSRKRGIENPDTGWVYPGATIENKPAAHTKCGLVEGSRSNRRWYPFCALKFKELFWQLRNLTCGLRTSANPSIDNLTRQETTNHDAPEVGPDGGDLSCPGSGEVARMDYVGQRDFKLDIDTETIERELHTSEEYQEFWESEE